MKYAIYIIIALSLVFLGRRSAQYTYDKYSNKFISVSTYKARQRNILFLGDSHVSLGNWTCLLDRCDVANQGYSGATSKNMLSSLKIVPALRPQKVLIMSGVNNILLDSPKESYLADIATTVDALKDNDIEPILHNIICIREGSWNAAAINPVIRDWNKSLDSLCRSKGVPVINLNRIISDSTGLIATYSRPDGVHLNEEGYRVWAIEILKTL